MNLLRGLLFVFALAAAAPAFGLSPEDCAQLDECARVRAALSTLADPAASLQRLDEALDAFVFSGNVTEEAFWLCLRLAADFNRPDSIRLRAMRIVDSMAAYNPGDMNVVRGKMFERTIPPNAGLFLELFQNLSRSTSVELRQAAFTFFGDLTPTIPARYIQPLGGYFTNAIALGLLDPEPNIRENTLWSLEQMLRIKAVSPAWAEPHLRRLKADADDSVRDYARMLSEQYR